MSKVMHALDRGMYFEDFEAGFKAQTLGRTITESDVVNFANLTGDYVPLHTDEEFAKRSHFGTRVAHGMLGLAYAVGLATRLGFLDGTVEAFRSVDWKFSGPIYIGDTIHVVIEVVKTRPMRRLGAGIVDFDVSVVNQKDEVVQKGQWRALVKSRDNA